MATKRYVQHISGQGEKWEMREEYGGASDWRVVAHSPTAYHFLPKSEYVLCPPPERWVDVTAECEIDRRGRLTHNGQHTMVENGYRRRIVQIKGSDGPKTAVIIEQKAND